MITVREKRTLENVSNLDGTSSTIMYGENIGEIREDVATGYPYTRFIQSWFNGGVARGRGAVKWKHQPPLTDWATKAYPGGFDPKSGILGNAEQASIVGFASVHGAGVNFCYGDASVHLMPRSTDWQTLYALFGIADGDRETNFE